MMTDLDQEDIKSKKQPKQKITSLLKTVALYALMFVVIYSAVNWWRQPIMPANPQLQLTDYQGQTVDLAAMSHEHPTLVYFWGTWCSVCSFTSPITFTFSQFTFSRIFPTLKNCQMLEIQSRFVPINTIR